MKKRFQKPPLGISETFWSLLFWEYCICSWSTRSRLVGSSGSVRRSSGQERSSSWPGRGSSGPWRSSSILGWRSSGPERRSFRSGRRSSGPGREKFRKDITSTREETETQSSERWWQLNLTKFRGRLWWTGNWRERLQSWNKGCRVGKGLERSLQISKPCCPDRF